MKYDSMMYLLLNIDDKKSFYFADNDQRIVFSSPDLPLLVTFDNSVGIHTVWKIRKATVQVATSA